MTTYNVGDIVLVPFPFADFRTTKKRPALILSRVLSHTLPPLVVIAMITSILNAETVLGDYELEHWEKSGLLRPSKVRLAKVVSLEEKMILSKLGVLQSEDQKAIKHGLKKLLSIWL